MTAPLPQTRLGSLETKGRIKVTVMTPIALKPGGSGVGGTEQSVLLPVTPVSINNPSPRVTSPLPARHRVNAGM